MWLNERMEQLGIDSDTLAEILGYSQGASIRAWVHKKRTSHNVSDIEGITELASALDWTVTELLIAIGHDLDISSDPEALALLERYNQLKPKQKLIVLRFWLAAIELAEQTDIDSL